TFPTTQMDQFYVVDDTAGEYSQTNSVDLRETPWSVSAPYVAGGSVPVSTTRHLMLPLARAQHVFNLILTSGAGTTFPVTLGAEPSLAGVNPGNGQVETRALGFLSATVYPSATTGFHLLDITAFEQGPANATDVRNVTWGPILLPTITRVAGMALAAH